MTMIGYVWFDSLNDELSLEAQEFSIIKRSDHGSFSSYVEKVRVLAQKVSSKVSQEDQIEWFFVGIEDKHKSSDLYQD